MITADEAVFPNNVVELIQLRMDAVIDPSPEKDVFVTTRPLRNTDPRQSVGVFAQLWTPDEQSLEIVGQMPSEPTLQQYVLGVQAFIKDGDEEVGLATHSVLSTRVRRVLYRDQALRVALRGLSVTDEFGATETLKRWGIRNARYFSNEIDAQWVYLSTLEYWIETEIR